MRRHQALAEELVSQIADGRYKVGGKLPTEPELSRMHGMARGTVRQALDRLEQLGMIDRRPSIGTTVVSDRPHPLYQTAVRSTDEISELAASTKLLRPWMGEIVLDAARARRLDLRRGTSWFLVEGVRVRRDRPSAAQCWSEHYLRSDLSSEGIVRGDPVPSEDLDRYRIEQTISASLLSDAHATALDAEPGAPALVVTRRLTDPDLGLINVGVHTHPADRYTITSVVSPGG